jgi:hypothetical protein
MNPTPLGAAPLALAVPPRNTARRWRAGASLAVLALTATPLVAVPASAAEPSDAPATGSTAAAAPVFTGTLEVDGTTAVGSTLTLDETGGSWDPTPESLAYSWLLSDDAVLDAADVLVDGATSPSLVLAPEHVDRYLISTVAATAQGETSEPVAAPAVGPVVAGETVPGTPSIFGIVRVDSTLTARTGTWPEGTTFTYAWLVDGVTVATTPTFTPQGAYQGKSLRLDVTGVRDGYAPTTASSATVTVGSGVFTTTRPRIQGTVKVGALVEASTGHFSPRASLRYQWRANGTAIAGATGRTFRIPLSLHGDQLTVRVFGSRTGYPTTNVTSVPSVVVKPFTRTSRPTITGTLRVGQTLTANRGTWSPTPTSVSYQWRAEGRAIAGATGRTYRLTPKEHGKNISVEVTGRRATYITATERSYVTAAVKWPVGVTMPKVTKNPVKYVATNVGTTVTLKVSATGGSLRYQWQRWTPATGWKTLSGKTSSTLRFDASTSHDLNRFRVVVSNMVGKDYSGVTYVWVQSSLRSPFPAEQWFGLWTFNTAFSKSVDNFNGYLAANVYVCAAPGFRPNTGNLQVNFIGSNGRVYADAGRELRDHLSQGVDLGGNGCGYFGVYSNAPQSVREGGRWRITDTTDGQVSRQWVKYERTTMAEMNGGQSVSPFSGSGGITSWADGAAVAPLTEARDAISD